MASKYILVSNDLATRIKSGMYPAGSRMPSENQLIQEYGVSRDTLRKALAEKMGHATVIIVAQRVGTIMNADRIVVLDEGKIAGIGTHKQLLQSCTVYRQIAESQLSEEDLKR